MQSRDQQQSLRDELQQAREDVDDRDQQHQLLQDDLQSALTTLQSQHDKQQAWQLPAEAATEIQGDCHRKLLPEMHRAQVDLAKFASIVNSLRSQSDSDAESLFKALRRGEYKWTIAETLDSLPDQHSERLYPWHDWSNANMLTAKTKCSEFLDGKAT